MSDLSNSMRTRKLLVIPSALVVGVGSALGAFETLGTEGAHYFAYRGNIVNKFFVKQGWFWFTVAFWVSVFSRSSNKRYLSKSMLRWLAATLGWILFTQWFFGAPIMDRLFMLTGGSCTIAPDSGAVVTSRQCRGNGGQWEGGHDPSGHVFLLTLSSSVILLELLPVMRELFSGEASLFDKKKLLVVLGVQFLNYAMLFLTCLYFHSLLEKVSGFVAALGGLALVLFINNLVTPSVALPHEKSSLNSKS